MAKNHPHDSPLSACGRSYLIRFHAQLLTQLQFHDNSDSPNIHCLYRKQRQLPVSRHKQTIDLFEGEAAREALRIIRTLADAGFVAYLAGGCVRDGLLGRVPKDFDVATDATPNSVREVFGRRKTLAFGASFGVIGVLPENRQRADEAVEPTEVATFRSDGTYSDGRRPDSVHFGNAEEDAKRRDFTINGLFYDPCKHEVIDYVGGQQDLQKRVLRAIGDAQMRFDEDKLRMLRAVRLVTTIDFAIEAKTHDAIREHADAIAVVSGERIGAEMRRILTSPLAASGLRRVEETGLGRTILPEFDGIDHLPIESHLQALPSHDFSSCMASALIGAGLDDAPLTQITHRWKLSNQEQREILAAIKHWEAYAHADKLPWSEIQPLLINRDAAIIGNVAEAVVRARGLPANGIARASDALSWPPERLDPPPLMTGDDLRDAGVPAGPVYKTILQTLRNKQLDGEITTPEEAITVARELA